VIQASQNKLGTYTLYDRFVRKRSLPFHLPDDPIIKIDSSLRTLKHEPNCPKFSCNFCFVLTLSTLTFIEFVPGSTRDRYFHPLRIATLDSFSLQGKGGTLL